MNDLQALFEQIELAVVGAADCIQKHNLQILESYFTRVKPGEEAEAQVLPGEFNPVCPPLDSPLYKGTFTPITVALQFPLMNPLAREVAKKEEADAAAEATHPHHGDHGPTEGPVVHTVTVPLISLAPPSSYYIDEVTTRLEVEVQMDGEGNESYILVAPTSRGASAEAVREGAVGFLEVTIKRGPDPDSLTEILRGYDRSVRAQIPG